MKDAPEAFFKLCMLYGICGTGIEKDAGDRLKGRGHGSSVTEIEMPLVFTLADMENEGIIACREALTEYGDKLAVRIAELEKQIYEEAGEEFNINSPKQLGSSSLKNWNSHLNTPKDQNRLFNSR